MKTRRESGDKAHWDVLTDASSMSTAQPSGRKAAISSCSTNRVRMSASLFFSRFKQISYRG